VSASEKERLRYHLESCDRLWIGALSSWKWRLICPRQIFRCSESLLTNRAEIVQTPERAREDAGDPDSFETIGKAMKANAVPGGRRYCHDAPVGWGQRYAEELALWGINGSPV